ncbi:MAG TPA: hypothetical protein VGE18_01875 [Candidatus Paceibacterota bacterium]
MKKILFLALIATIAASAAHAQQDTVVSYNRIIFPENPRDTSEVIVRGISPSYDNKTFRCLIEYKTKYASEQRFAHIVFTLVNAENELIRRLVIRRSFKGQTSGFWDISFNSPIPPHEIFLGVQVREGEDALASKKEDLIGRAIKLYNHKIAP